MELEQTYTLENLVELEDNGILPRGYGFKIQGGKTVYKSIGEQWRRSGSPTYLSGLGFDEHESWADEKKRRYVSADTQIELVQL